MIWIIIGLFSSLLVLVFTFSFLEFKSLSFIPLCSLFVVSIMTIFLILQGFRYSVINKVISEEYKIDRDFLILIMNTNKSNLAEQNKEQ